LDVHHTDVWHPDGNRSFVVLAATALAVLFGLQQQTVPLQNRYTQAVMRSSQVELPCFWFAATHECDVIQTSTASARGGTDHFVCFRFVFDLFSHRTYSIHVVCGIVSYHNDVVLSQCSVADLLERVNVDTLNKRIR
jgi:hypothetical protein